MILNPKRITTNIKPEKKNEVPILTILKCETSAPCLKCIPITTYSRRKIYMWQKKRQYLLQLPSLQFRKYK